jgi:hypothetical protein
MYASAQINPPSPPAPPAPPAPGTSSSQQDDTQIRFAYGGDVAQIPAQFVSSLVFLPVTVNQGPPSLFLLDSTALVSSIDPKRAESVGLTVDEGSNVVRSAVMELPGVQWKLPGLKVASRDGLPPITGRVYQGTLGLDFLSHVVVEIDYSRRTVQIYDPHSFAGPPSKRPVEAVKWTNGLPHVSLKFSVHGERSIAAPFLVDSAQQAGIVFRDSYVSEHKKDFQHLKKISGIYAEETAATPAVFGRLNLFGLDKFELPNLIAAFPHGPMENESDSTAAGLVGAGFLRRFVFVFDLPHQQILFEPNIHFIDRDDIGMSGLTILARGSNHKSFEVVFVDPGSPGAQAGVQVGDVIEGIDDEAAADLTLDQVKDMFRQLDTKYKVLLGREGKTVTVNIQTRRLI